MVDYEKIQQHDNDDLQSQSFLKDSRTEEDRESSDDDSTIVGGGPRMKKNSLHLNHKTVLSLLTFLGMILTALTALLIWLVSLHPTHRSILAQQQAPALKDDGTRRFPPSAGISSCGTTAAEAIAAGCHFDALSFGWTPRECSDMQLYNESMATLRSQTGGSPAFFTSTHEPVLLSAVESYAAGMPSSASSSSSSSAGGALGDDGEIFRTWEHYLVACAYGWQKVQRAAMRNWPLEEWSASYGLAERCGRDLLTREKRPSESVVSSLKPWYPVCGLEAAQMRREMETVLRG